MLTIANFLRFLLKRGQKNAPPSVQKLLPGFYFIAGWHWSNPKGILPNLSEREFKLRFFFDEHELPTLASSPFLVKFRINRNPEKSFDYCGYAYPAVADTEDDLRAFGQKFRDFLVVRRIDA